MYSKSISFKKWFKEVSACNFPRLRTLRHIKANFLARHMTWHEAISRTTYQKKFNCEPDFENPKTLSEKLNWLKLNDQSELLPVVADKFAVREYVSNKGYQSLLNPVLAVYNNVKDVDFSALPEKFAIKATHGSGWNIIQSKKDKYSIAHMRNRMRRWLSTDMSLEKGELAYQPIKPRIIVEELLDNGGKELPDYKFFCFAGEVKFLKYIEGRFGTPTSVYLDPDWSPMPFRDKKQVPLPFFPDRPASLETMVAAAKKLSADFPFARVDFYDIKGKAIFGEITLYPEGGFVLMKPEKYDFEIGKMIDLSAFSQPNSPAKDHLESEKA